MDMAALFADVSIGLSQTFGGPYHPGVIITQTDAVFDDGGSILIPGGVDRAACMVQIDAVSEAMRPEGWTDRDYRFLILVASIKSGDLSGVLPSFDTDKTVEVLSGPYPGTWLVSSVQGDAFGTYYSGKGRRA